jgi:hypothetical protein
MAIGGYGRVTSATAFVAGEKAGGEDVVFGGAGRNLAKDVAVELVPYLAGVRGGGGTPTVIKTEVNLDGRTIARAVHDVYDRNVGGLRTEARELLGVRG